jgi:hypothetical protein
MTPFAAVHESAIDAVVSRLFDARMKKAPPVVPLSTCRLWRTRLPEFMQPSSAGAALQPRSRRHPGWVDGRISESSRG